MITTNSYYTAVSLYFQPTCTHLHRSMPGLDDRVLHNYQNMHPQSAANMGIFQIPSPREDGQLCDCKQCGIWQELEHSFVSKVLNCESELQRIWQDNLNTDLSSILKETFDQQLTNWYCSVKKVDKTIDKLSCGKLELQHSHFINLEKNIWKRHLTD